MLNMKINVLFITDTLWGSTFNMISFLRGGVYAVGVRFCTITPSY